MIRFKTVMYLLVMMYGLFTAYPAAAAVNGPVRDMVTMIDLGSDMCTPCRRMMPVLQEVAQEYRGRAAIIYIDVGEDDGMDKKYGLRTIPTQIFYDKTGKEVYRHEGFLAKQNIVRVLNEIGVPSLESMMPAPGAAGSGRPDFPPVPAVSPPPQAMVYPPGYQPPVGPQTGQPPVMVPGSGYQSVPMQPGWPLGMQPGAPLGMQPGGFPQYPPGAVISPASLLTPGVVNLLFFDANAQKPQENIWNLFSELERQYKGQVSILAIDANTNQGLAGGLGVRSTPMVIMYDAAGQEVLRHPGAPSLAAIQDVLTKLLK